MLRHKYLIKKKDLIDMSDIFTHGIMKKNYTVLVELLTAVQLASGVNKVHFPPLPTHAENSIRN